MEVRSYENKDFEEIWELHNAALSHVNAHGGNGVWDDDLKNIQSVYLDNGGQFLVGLDDQKIVAMGALKKVDQKTVEIKRMRVHPSKQGLGYGKQMLSELTQNARKIGYSKVVLDTTTKQIAAQQMYLKDGFKEVKRGKMGSFEVIFYEKEL